MHEAHISTFKCRRNLYQIHSQDTSLCDQSVNQLTNLYPVQTAGSWCIDSWHDGGIKAVGINSEVVGSTIRNPLKNCIDANVVHFICCN